MPRASFRAARSWRQRGAAFLVLALFAQITTSKAFAGGPRFVSGTGLAVSSGLAEGWNTTQLAYFTDPGDLAANVSHAQADSMVAAAAAVWNVPTSSLSLSRGGALSEHVSSGDAYFDGENFVFPADVQTSNERSVPVPVLYDTDGSVTDLLLGAGASEPMGCRQNAVTESVDDLQSDGYIHHAILILNGRCVGGAPEQLTQMQYQLARAFGRILGIAWSQTNDNVFTAATTVTADQEAYWPLMHPLDVLCGTYSYQCLPKPFTLRPDDISAMTFLYPVSAGNVPAGKQVTANGADFLYLEYQFPTGQGMALVNVTATRQQYGITDDYEIVSGVTGALYQQSLASPVTGVQAVNEGSTSSAYETYAFLREVPLGGTPNVILTTEPINTLYSGEYAVAPYADRREPRRVLLIRRCFPFCSKGRTAPWGPSCTRAMRPRAATPETTAWSTRPQRLAAAVGKRVCCVGGATTRGGAQRFGLAARGLWRSPRPTKPAWPAQASHSR